MSSAVLNTAAAQGATFHNVMGSVRDVYSAEIYLTALPVMKFEQFTTKKSELGVQPGLTIQLPRFSSIKRGGRLREGHRVPIQAMNQTQMPITVHEYGNGIGFSERLLQASFYDQMAAASLLLGRDMSVVLDTELRDVIMGAPTVIFPNGKSARTALTGSDTFSTTLIKDGVEALESENAPKWGNDHWICFSHPHQGRSLRDDNNWINAAMYSGLGQVYTGEIGRYEDVRFIVTTMMPNGRNGAVNPITGDFEDLGFDETLESGKFGNQETIYRAVLFGEYTLGHAVAVPVELRDNNNNDFGREHGLAWYSVFGQAVLETKNVVIMETT
jgi:N4-gp56 family major capsid protein